jgi:hypothetical protein
MPESRELIPPHPDHLEPQAGEHELLAVGVGPGDRARLEVKLGRIAALGAGLA